ncbi:MAG TPA: sialidase family protein [Gammaproteobacteria bacterium]
MRMRFPFILALVCGGLLSACGGGSSSSSTSSAATTPSEPTLGPPSSTLVRVSQASPYAADCGGGAGDSGATSYEDAEVEPYLAINPLNPSNLVGAWQQDRWSDGGAHGLVAGSSMDGGKTWKEHTLPLSVCAGGTSANGGNYGRASDPWVSFSPDGTVYVISISFTGNTLQAGSNGGVLVSRSTDGGVSWSDAATLIHDGSSAFNDKETVTADPTDSHFVYAVWDRLTLSNHGAAMFARTTDGGSTWEPATAIYDPGVNNQTLGNEIVVASDGTLLDLFEEIDDTSSAAATADIRLISSKDHGASWSAPITVAANLAVGAADPNTGNLIRSGAGLPQMAAGPGGMLAVVWEDGRFSDGDHDGIAYASSRDDGAHWTKPAEINSVRGVPAFTPSVAILGDGTVGVSYFDFRDHTTGPTLPTDYWFISSEDGSHWSEQHITGPFDLAIAPDAEGLFIGDYEALGKVGSMFVPFFVQTNDAGTDNRTDSYYLPPQPKPLMVVHKATHLALTAETLTPGAGFRHRVHENIMRVLRDEDPVWDSIRAARQKRPQPP